MKTLGAAIVIALSLLASYWVGVKAARHHDQLYRNVCLIDQTNVNLLEQSLAGITRSDVKTYGLRRIKKARRLTIKYVNRYSEIAPCTIRVKIPPLPLLPE